MKQSQIVIKGLLFLFSLVLFGNPIKAQKSLDNKTLVTIGNEPVTVGEFMRIYNKNNTQTSLQEPSTIQEYLDLFINFKLKVREATDLKMDTNSAFKKELAGYREQLAKPYFIDESVNEALLKEAYERELKDVRASHILIMVSENARPEDTLAAYNKIMKIRDEIMAGKDFGEAAAEYSDDPSAHDREEIPGKQRARKGNKGDLGYFTVFNMVYPFECAAYNTPVGEVSQPIRTKYGYHLVYVTDKRDALGVAQVAHIFVALTPSSTKEDSVRQKEKIENIYQKIQDGMSFEDAVVKYSEDKGSARNGGKLSQFTCNRVVPEFVLAVESLDTNEISNPVQTAYGYHIIKLISRDRPGTFEQESEKLKERLKKDERSHKSEEIVLQRIKDENGLKIYDKAKQALFTEIDTSVLDNTFKADHFNTYTKPIMKIGKQKYNQFDFAQYVAKNQKKQNNIDKDVYLENLFNEFVDEKCLDYADKHLEDNYPEFKALMKEYHDGILLFNLTDEKVWTKAVKDTLGLEKYFNANNSKYMWGKRVDATIYQIRKKEDLEKVKKLIEENDSDGDIARSLDEDSIQSVKIIPGKFEKGDNPYIDKVEWKAGNLVEIPSDVENLVTIVKIKEVLQPELKKFNEARGIATADYQNFLEKEWIAKLKEKYPVVINEEVLQQLLKTQ
jgi:peptidyl-prolyl cis-trans isomerase SurA